MTTIKVLDLTQVDYYHLLNCGDPTPHVIKTGEKTDLI